MAVFVLTFFIFVAVIAVSGVLFTGWVTAGMLRLAWRGAVLALGLDWPAVRDGTVGCPHLRCAERNPTSARFCRRCGRSLGRHATARGGDAPQPSSWLNL